MYHQAMAAKHLLSMVVISKHSQVNQDKYEETSDMVQLSL